MTNKTPTSHVSDIPEDKPIIPRRQQPTVDTTEFRTVTVGTLPLKPLMLKPQLKNRDPCTQRRVGTR